MAIKRLWKGRPRGLSELPVGIREHEPFQASDWWIQSIMLSSNGLYYRLHFDIPCQNQVVYFQLVEGKWEPCEGPTVEELMKGL